MRTGLHAEISRAPELPRPGSGRTPARMEALAAVAGRDLSVGRLYEGHTDAMAILAEAGRAPAAPGVAYGVWAARSPRDPTTARPRAAGWVLSGFGIIGRALVSADAPDGYRLFDVDLAAGGITAVDGSWPAVGMAGSASLTVTFDSTPVGALGAVGAPGFYTGRPGFWFGAVGVAACWYGGAVGLVGRLVDRFPTTANEHALSELGRCIARVTAMHAVLEAATRAIDADPADTTGRARYRALAVREAVHGHCVEILAHAAGAGGARVLGHDADQARRAADLYVYLSQHHSGADAAVIGRLALEHRSSWH